MREILFKAKDLSGNWVEGDLHLCSKMPHIHSDVFTTHYIDKETISQFTGKLDVNKTKIFSDVDVVKFKLKEGEGFVELTGVFCFDEEELRYQIEVINHHPYYCLWYNSEIMSDFEVIGNIFDNPELIN